MSLCFLFKIYGLLSQPKGCKCDPGNSFIVFYFIRHELCLCLAMALACLSRPEVQDFWRMAGSGLSWEELGSGVREYWFESYPAAYWWCVTFGKSLSSLESQFLLGVLSRVLAESFQLCYED